MRARMGYRPAVGARTNWLIPLAVVGALCAPSGCTLARREVMLVLTTDVDCTVLDRFEVSLRRGSAQSDIVWSRKYLRNDCPAVGESLPRAPLARGNGVDPGVAYRLGVVDARRTDERVHIEVVGFRADGTRVMATAAETDFVDGQVYAVPVELTSVCLSALVCPANYVCRRDPSGGAGCGSVYRSPGTLGTFAAPSALRVTDTAVLDED